MIPISLIWDSRGRDLCQAHCPSRDQGIDGEVSIFTLRRTLAMVEALFGKFPDMVEKTVDIIRGRKKGKTSEPKG